jgi:hypothetical protein
MSDGTTYLWFTKLVFLDGVQKILESVQMPVHQYLQTYRIYSVMAWMLLAVFAMDMGLVLLTKGMNPFLIIVTGILAVRAAWHFLMKRREQIACLAARLIEVNMPEDPLGMTLYQMGEIYARRYQGPSLVETIWSWDYLLNYTFLFVYFGAFGLYFLSFWNTIVWTTIACVLAVCIYQICFLIRKA